MKHNGVITPQGALRIYNRPLFEEEVRAMSREKDLAVTVEVKLKKRFRSDVQNAYYWGVVIAMIVERLRELGHDVDRDLTHEFLEMCSDPTTNVLIALPGMPGYSCLREVGDAVEADQFGYEINGVLVTDWCTPEYFYQIGHSPVPRGMYDFMNHIHAPAPALLDGGYLGIQAPDGSWSMVSDFVGASGVFSRRARRTMGRINRVARRA